MKTYIFFLAAAASIVAVQAKRVDDHKYTTPTAILKQINKHNEDGSYSYGYEGADGTFKIETKYPNGEVYGKYGYIDDQGKLREIEYGATRRGFEPAGSEINVPPPTLDKNPDATRPLGPDEEDDGQYREDPSYYYKDEKNSRDPPRQQNSYPVWNNPRANSWYDQDYRTQPSRLDEFDNFIFDNPTTPRPYYRPTPAPYNPPPPRYNPPPPPAYNPPPPAYNPPPPAYNPPPYNPPYNPHYNNYNAYNNYYPQNPYVRNIDYYTGSYSIDYRR